MTLRLRINLALIASFVVAFLLAGGLAFQHEFALARTNVIDKARFMLSTAIAIRGYTVSEVRPLLAQLPPGDFLPQTVPAYAAHSTFFRVQIDHPDYAYRETVLRPTNPADAPTPWEMELIQALIRDGGTAEMIGERMTAAGRQLYLAHPITIDNEACLACHSTPDVAPEAMVAKYGSSAGFGWELGETVGAQVVTVPMDLALTNARSTLLTFLISLASVFAVVFLVINIAVERLVIGPLRALTRRAEEASLGRGSVAASTTAPGEMGALARSIERMERSLKAAVGLSRPPGGEGPEDAARQRPGGD